MKKLVIPLMVGIVAVGTLVLAQPSSAATVAPNGTCRGMTSVYGQHCGSAARHANATAPVVDWTYAGSHVSVQIHFGTALVTFTHADVESYVFRDVFGTTASAAAFACGLLTAVPLVGWLAAAACAAWVIGNAGVMLLYMDYAANYVTWQVCGQAFAWSWCNPGYQVTVTGALVEPVTDSGLNVLYTWGGQPIGYEVNTVSG